MTSVGFRIPTNTQGNLQDLHPAAWEKLCSEASANRTENDLLLHGPAGIGKSLLLRRVYWDLFDNQDIEVPLLTAIPAGHFHPRLWARRFLHEVVQQWLAWINHDHDLTEASVLPTGVLIERCHSARLAAVGAALGALDTLIAEEPEHDHLLRWTMETLAHLAHLTNQPLLLMIDGSENARWKEQDQPRYLTDSLPPLNGMLGRSGLKRVWASRQAPGNAHPLSSPLPPTDGECPLRPLTDQIAADFVRDLAHVYHLDYDPETLQEFLPLWGGIPRWLANLVRKGSELGQPLLTGEAVLETYIADITGGPSGRDMRAALYPTANDHLEPTALAHAMQACLHRESTPQTTPYDRAAGQARQDDALQRLARAGLVHYDRGNWHTVDVPLVVDALGLFVDQHLHGESLERRCIALKRRYLVETPQRNERYDTERRLDDIALLLRLFEGQQVPQTLIEAHRRHSDTAPANEAALGSVRESKRATRLPRCIGAWVHRDRTQGERTHHDKALDTPPVVGWCFEEEGYFRSDEAVWVAHICDVSVVTSEEVGQMHRLSRSIARELNVGHARTWILTDARFSAEGAQRAIRLEAACSSWSDFREIGRVLMRGDKPEKEPDLAETQASGMADRVRKSTPSESETEAPPLAIDEKEADERVQKALAQWELGKDLILGLPPVEGMELVAAKAAEEVALAADFEGEATDQVKMAVLEGCLNAVERSRNPEKEVRVVLTASRTKVSIVIENEGAVFDPQTVEQPDIDEKLGSTYKRGWGLQLIRKFMDRVVYEPFGQGTRLRMEKFNAAPASELPDMEAVELPETTQAQD